MDIRGLLLFTEVQSRYSGIRDLVVRRDHAGIVASGMGLGQPINIFFNPVLSQTPTT